MARRRSSSVYIGRTRYPGIEGLEAILRGIASLPDELEYDVSAAVNSAAGAVVRRYKRRAPVSKLEARKGALRDSAHVEPGDHSLSAVVMVDGRGDDGEFIAKHVELGHLAPDGSHVPPQPAFYPALRASRAPAQREIGAAMRKSVAKVQARMAGQ